jgi:hypothetical protein
MDTKAVPFVKKPNQNYISALGVSRETDIEFLPNRHAFLDKTNPRLRLLTSVVSRQPTDSTSVSVCGSQRTSEKKDMRLTYG